MTAATGALAALGELDRTEVLAAVAAVDVAEKPVVAEHFRALRDPALRRAVNEALASEGRELIEHELGWLSAYRDDIADRLQEEGLGVLGRTDRAVLTLVLLHSVAIPRARGRLDSDDWMQAIPTTMDELKKSQSLTARDIQVSVRRLRTLGVLHHGNRGAIAPGPQFLRLTKQRTGRLAEELVLLCRPTGMLAQVIRRRRDAATHEEVTHA
ncbi:MAG: hypothetical protein ACRDM7_01470 [Thermoleophilaceae bacterium]